MEIVKDFRAFIEKAFAERRTKNSRYSMRAFARDIGISPGQLSLVLNGKRGLSSARAIEISRQLGLSAREAELFRTLVEMSHSRSALERKIAEDRLHALYEGASSETGASHAFILSLSPAEAREARERIDGFVRELGERFDGEDESGEMHVVHFRFFRVAEPGDESGKS